MLPCFSNRGLPQSPGFQVQGKGGEPTSSSGGPGGLMSSSPDDLTKVMLRPALSLGDLVATIVSRST